MSPTAAIISALGAAVAVALTSWARVIKARSDAGRPKQLLRRVWDWLEAVGLHVKMPPSLVAEIRDELKSETEPE